jgi:hypothetical protein
VCDFLRGVGSHDIVTGWPLVAAVPDVHCEPGRSTATFGTSRIQWRSSAAHVDAELLATRRSPRFGVELDASALHLSLGTTALPITTVAAFSAQASTPVDIAVTPDAATITFPASNGSLGVCVRLRPGQAPALTNR